MPRDSLERHDLSNLNKTPLGNIVSEETAYNDYNPPHVSFSPEAIETKSGSIKKDRHGIFSRFKRHLKSHGKLKDEPVRGMKWFDYSNTPKVAHKISKSEFEHKTLAGSFIKNVQRQVSSSNESLNNYLASHTDDSFSSLREGEDDDEDKISARSTQSNTNDTYDYQSIYDVYPLSIPKQREYLLMEKSMHCGVFHRNNHADVGTYRPDRDLFCCDEDYGVDGPSEESDCYSKTPVLELKRDSKGVFQSAESSVLDSNESVLLGKNSKNPKRLLNAITNTMTTSCTEYTRGTLESENNIKKILKRVPGIHDDDLNRFLDEKLCSNGQSNLNASSNLNTDKNTTKVTKRNFYDSNLGKEELKNISSNQQIQQRKHKQQSLMSEISSRPQHKLKFLSNKNSNNNILESPHTSSSFSPNKKTSHQSVEKEPMFLSQLKLYFDEMNDGSKFGDISKLLNKEQLLIQYKIYKRERKDISNYRSSNNLKNETIANKLLWSKNENGAKNGKVPTDKLLSDEHFRNLCNDIWSLDAIRF